MLLFDGVCNLCNNTVQYIIRNDKKNRFHFASLQGTTGQELLRKFNLPDNVFNSFVLVEEDNIYTKSTGALKVFRKLGGLWSLLYVFIIVPRFIRDGVYNWVAKNRYRWFGKADHCMVPTPELRAKFLD
ncbi:MAG: thiol-disulfide oxidoreductase DCC family protein [Agriterribacter sp.]